jgi:hypothetical protein
MPLKTRQKRGKSGKTEKRRASNCEEAERQKRENRKEKREYKSPQHLPDEGLKTKTKTKKEDICPNKKQ